VTGGVTSRVLQKPSLGFTSLSEGKIRKTCVRGVSQWENGVPGEHGLLPRYVLPGDRSKGEAALLFSGSKQQEARRKIIGRLP